MILEELMLDLMYHLPSQKKVKEFEVTREMVEKRDVSIGHAGKSRIRTRSAMSPASERGFSLCRLESMR